MRRRCLLLAQVVFAALYALAGETGAQTQAQAVNKKTATVWPSRPPADCPFAPSTDASGIAFTDAVRH